ncbi:unnamed protein product [Pleuronectes platessa]|uniref:Uncharacterized protein n=1 Tax=Pleuronectes platessa TaxID=8262 RepID=A0A9N7Y384_PLEPL|nr:unnamed protein product [Pleuronectes platessa]
MHLWPCTPGEDACQEVPARRRTFKLLSDMHSIPDNLRISSRGVVQDAPRPHLIAETIYCPNIHVPVSYSLETPGRDTGCCFAHAGGEVDVLQLIDPSQASEVMAHKGALTT